MGLYEKIASGMSANKLFLDVTANNITNMNTTRTEQGGPYQRQSVVFKEKSSFNEFFQQETGGGVEVESVRQDPSFRTVYDPDHPDADEKGFVKYPSINITAEMTNMVIAQRGYGASVTLFNQVKELNDKTMQIGKG
ncbi:flagellar basal body rod protein FlgC [Bacillus bombysepticus]|uniref:flagellar basal body rod protein FlgC n=1 Tax=Bacillus bombysepticus TaxID=658666 RepID=UPI00301680CB